MRADHRLASAIDDSLASEEARPDDAERARIATMLDGLVAGLEREIARAAARLLAGHGEPALIDALNGETPQALNRLVEAGLVRDAELMREMIGRVREARLAEALPAQAPDEPDRPGLLNRLIDGPDSVAAAAAMALMLAESRRRGLTDRIIGRADLPAELQHRLAWWIAAALRERLAPLAGDGLASLDSALTEATQRSLAAHDEGDRVEAAAMRLAAAIDPNPSELPDMLVEALSDRRPALAVALVARALDVDYPIARTMLLDLAGDQLWLALRALDFPREAIARVGLALCEADPRRNLDEFAESLDTIAAIAPDAAHAALASLRLHPDFRAALLALARGGNR